MPPYGGTVLTLAASAARTASADGTAQKCEHYKRFAVLFSLTNAATDNGDTLDVYIDFSPDGGTTWINGGHFTQVQGDGADAIEQWMVFDPSAPGAVVVAVTNDAGSGVVRPSVFGNQIRARWAITDAGADNATFTFEVKAFAQP